MKDNTYNAWLTGDTYTNKLIINNARRMETGGNTINEIGVDCYTSWNDAGGYVWWDDIKIIGGYYQTGIWESTPIEL